MATKKGFCKLHQRKEKLVAAHIVPRALFPGVSSQDDAPPKTYSGRVIGGDIQTVTRKRTPIGWYDQELVCLDAERLFQRWDDYAIKTLRRQPKRSEWMRDENKLIAKIDGYKLAYRFKDVDYSKLKLFHLSLLWRASASSRFEFGGVKLGLREDKLRQMILSQDPGTSEDFSVLTMRFAESAVRTQILFHPSTQTIAGITFARFTFGGFMIDIKIDKAETPEEFREFQLSPHQGLLVIQTKFDGSQLHSVAKELVSNFKAA